MAHLIDLFVHLDAYLNIVIQQYGVWIYCILFVVVFLETGVVVTPFLPGDSLLFTAGALAARGDLAVGWLFLLLLLAAVLGDTVNYSIGHIVGPRAFHGQNRFFKREHLDRTHQFYERHGGKTIVLARFIPIMRTFAPFVSARRTCHVAVLCFMLGLLVGQAWGQNLAVFPKEEILLVGGDFRLRSVNSNMAGASLLGGGESGGFPTQDGAPKSFFDTRLRLYSDFRPSDLLRVHYRMEIGDVRFGGSSAANGSDVTGNLVPVIGPGSGGGVGAGGVNVETKNIFLEFAMPFIPGLSFRGGIFGYGDRYDFNIIADDFAGFQFLYNRGDVSAHFVYFRFFQGDTRDNADNSNWFGIDGQLQVNESTRAAATFYYWSDQEHRGTLGFI